MISPERLDGLQTQWVRLMGGRGIEPGRAYPVFDRLVAAHTDPQRHYHNLEHVAEVLKVVGRLAKLAADPIAVQLAAWFHDVVYDVHRHDNEERSRQMAEEELTALGLPAELAERVGQLILATTHRDADADGDAALLLDADLAVLGAGEERYRRYADAIRREYAHVPDEAYRAGRAAVLRAFLDRPRIFRTDVLHLEGEANARRNLLAEIERLSTSPDRR